MSELQFETQENEFGRPPEAKPGFDFAGKLIQWGFVSNRKEAEYVLIAIGVVTLIAAWIAYRSIGGSEPPPLLPQ